MFILYKIGWFLALILPLRIGYLLAILLADLWHLVSYEDRLAVADNLKILLPSEKDIFSYSKLVFRNFAKYLVDFFRFSKIDEDYIKKYVKVEGREYLDSALSGKRGVIALTAHIGNWELGGTIMAMLGYSLNAIALEHKDRRINRFFINQREKKGVKVLSFGLDTKRYFDILADNQIIAILGDRDFSGNGVRVDFLGKLANLPKGPAVLCLRTGSPIVPGFMIRDKNAHFRFIFEKPIEAQRTGNIQEDIIQISKRFSNVIERFVRLYPTQWFMFRRFWEEERP
jgi:KDO2-lipid IV(A) lauroyltransferase